MTAKIDYTTEFREMLGNLSLNDSYLLKFTELISKPSCKALRFFLAVEQEKSPTAQWMANHIYEHKAAHNCYKNDSFYVAQSFGLDERRKKESSLWVIENAMGGYYEPLTHGEFRLSELLHQMGAMDYPVYGENYIALSHDKIRKMADKLGVSNEELAMSAENVINWTLRDAYNVAGVDSTFVGGTTIDIYQTHELVKLYLPQGRQKMFEPLFEEARRNIGTKNVREFFIENKQRI